MNYNAPGAQFRGIVAAITSSQLVVIDNRVPSVFILYLDAEFIDPTASINLAINRRKQETVCRYRLWYPCLCITHVLRLSPVPRSW